MDLRGLLDAQDAKERKAMNTLREQVEAELGCTPAKVGKRTPAWYIHQAPSAWRKTLKYWSALALGFVLGGIFSGVLVVLMGVAQ